MFYNIDSTSIKKLLEIESALNKVEVRGLENLSLLYSSLLLIQQIKQDIEKINNFSNVPNNNQQ